MSVVQSCRPMRAWHFLQADETLSHGDGREPKDLEWVRANRPPELWRDGMHANQSVFDALSYAPGPILCRVEVRGGVVRESGKICGWERRILWRIDATEMLWHFGRLCALDVVHRWDAPPVVRDYLRTGDESLRATARRATREEAVGALQPASAARAARNAASRSAWSAAWDAVWSIARSARGALQGAARKAARAKQSRRLERMVHAEHQRQTLETGVAA